LILFSKSKKAIRKGHKKKYIVVDFSDKRNPQEQIDEIQEEDKYDKDNEPHSQSRIKFIAQAFSICCHQQSHRILNVEILHFAF